MRIYHVITSLSFAIIISLLLLWFFIEFGWTTALIALAGAIASPWLTVFGRNLFYFPAFFYIPIVAATYYLHRYSTRIEQVPLKFGVVIFATMLLKCFFNGFDFILPSILMIGTPYVYFAIRDKWSISKFIKIGTVIAIGVTAAILTVLLILSFQIWSILGNYSNAVAYILNRFDERTVGYLPNAVAAQVNVWEVLSIYFRRKLAVGQTNLRFIDLISIFGIITAIYFLVEKLRKGLTTNLPKLHALMIATWASIFSPLLWYIIFKGQAYVHPHTNFLAWYMPFVIYGFAMCGYILENLYLSFKRTNKASE